MNQQFQTRFLLEDLDEFESLRSMLLDLGADKDAAEMLVNAVAKGRIEPSKAIEIVKSTTGLSEDGMGGGSTTGGGVTNGASFTPGAGEQMTGRKKAFKEDAPILAGGKRANIKTYTQDGFTKAEGHPKLKSIDIKNVWDTPPTAMSKIKEAWDFNTGGVKAWDLGKVLPEDMEAALSKIISTPGVTEKDLVGIRNRAQELYNDSRLTRNEWSFYKNTSLEDFKEMFLESTPMREDDYDEPDFTAADDDDADNLSEMSLKNPGMPEFLSYLKDNPEAVIKLGFRKLQNVIDYLESATLGDWDELRGELNQIVGGKDIGIYEQNGINENYHRFKRETRERPKQDQYHEAIRTVNKKLDEVNRILEFTSRMKNELAEEGGILEVKSRTAKTMDKMKMKIAEAYQKLKKLN